MTEENLRKKQYLERYKNLNREIDRMIDERATIMSRATKITPSYSEMPKGVDGDKIQQAVDKLCELDGEINAKIDAYVDMREEIERTIKTVGDERIETVLRYRYIDGMKWEQIAVKANYDYRWVLRLHGIGLQKVKLSQ
jgi:hypothetical protein